MVACRRSGSNFIEEYSDLQEPYNIRQSKRKLNEDEVVLSIAAVWLGLHQQGVSFSFADSISLGNARASPIEGKTWVPESDTLIIPLLFDKNKAYSPAAKAKQKGTTAAEKKARATNSSRGHFLLVVAERREGGIVRLTFMDSEADRLSRDFVREVARDIVRNSLWLPDKAWPVFDEEHERWPDTLQALTSVGSSHYGFHVVLDAWAFMLNVPLRNASELGTKRRESGLYEEFRKVIGLALEGRIDTTTIVAFMLKWGYAADANDPATVGFQPSETDQNTHDMRSVLMNQHILKRAIRSIRVTGSVPPHKGLSTNPPIKGLNEVEPFHVRFYQLFNDAVDTRGRSVHDILAWDDTQLERCHDYIQILFPLPETSRHNKSAPLLDEATFRAFRSRPDLRGRLSLSFNRMLRFYGFELEDKEGPSISQSPNYPKASKNWINSHNHNYQRITRILRSLRILGLEDEAGAFFSALKKVYDTNSKAIDSGTFEFWARAAERPLHLTPQDEKGEERGEKFLREHENQKASGKPLENPNNYKKKPEDPKNKPEKPDQPDMPEMLPKAPGADGRDGASATKTSQQWQKEFRTNLDNCRTKLSRSRPSRTEEFRRLSGHFNIQDESVILGIAAVWHSLYSKGVQFAFTTSLGFQNGNLLRFPAIGTPNPFIIPLTIMANDTDELIDETNMKVEAEEARVKVQAPKRGKGKGKGNWVGQIGHHVLVIAVINESWDGFSLEIMDSKVGFLASSIIQARAAAVVTNSGWFTPAPEAGGPVINNRAVPQQGTKNTCGINVILNAWAYMLAIPIISSTGPRQSQTTFYETAEELVNLALAGCLDSATIESFLRAHGYSPVDIPSTTRAMEATVEMPDTNVLDTFVSERLDEEAWGFAGS